MRTGRKAYTSMQECQIYRGQASRRQYKMFYSEKAMTVTVIVFFHAFITTENETIFFRASVNVIM